MEITNKEQVIKQIVEMIMEDIGEALDITVDNIISELPKGQSSSIAGDLYAEKISDTEYHVITTNIVWDYLNFGTGLWGPTHKPIVPINAKALHFKNAEIAMALGFPDENVFLRKVDGIRPMYFFERNIEGKEFDNVLNKVMSR